MTLESRLSRQGTRIVRAPGDSTNNPAVLRGLADEVVWQHSRIGEQHRAAVCAREPNDRLRQARLRMRSPSGSGRYMSRQELADLVNARLAVDGIRHGRLDETYIGKLERGVHRWPQEPYRAAFRAVLSTSTDAELGFYITRRQNGSGT